MVHRKPLLNSLYEKYRSDNDSAAWLSQISEKYTVATIERLVTDGSRKSRRAAVFALGFLADYQSNTVLGRALVDRDRGVRLAADAGIRKLWCRVGTTAQRKALRTVSRLNECKHWREAIRRATHLLQQSPWLAEAWYQRGVGYWRTGEYDASIQDFHQALEINPYHFCAAADIGHCYLEQRNRVAALQAFRRALRLNPGLEEVRARVVQLRRSLNDDGSSEKR